MSDYKKFKSKDGKEYFIPNSKINTKTTRDDCACEGYVEDICSGIEHCRVCVCYTKSPVHAEYMASLREPYPLDKVGNCTENGVMIEVSNTPDFAIYTTVEYIRYEPESVTPYKVLMPNKQADGFPYARHPQPKALTDEEIVGEGYVRLKVGDKKVKGYEYAFREMPNIWFFGFNFNDEITEDEFSVNYLRIKKPVPLTDTERHEILLLNVSADKCWVRHKAGGCIYNSWYTMAHINHYLIKLPDSTEYVEITDKVLRGLGGLIK